MENHFVNMYDSNRKRNRYILVILIILIVIVTAVIEKDVLLNIYYNKVDVARIKEITKEKDAERKLYQERMGEDISTGFAAPNTVPENDKIKKFKTTMGKVEPHILDNGEKGVYHNNGGHGWKLKKGEKIRISIKADKEYYGSSGNMIMKYNLADKEYSMEQFAIDKEKVITFNAPKTDAYSFSLLCISSDPIIIENLNIVKK